MSFQPGAFSQKKSQDMVYLDHNATSIPSETHLQQLLQFYAEHQGNPSSGHQKGRGASVGIHNARQWVAQALGVSSGELIFTSGATESNNTVLKGQENCHVVCSNFEHSSIYETLKKQEELNNLSFSMATFEEDSLSFLKNVLRHLRPETRLICLIGVQNETGHVLPVLQLAQFLHRKRWDVTNSGQDDQFFYALEECLPQEYDASYFQKIHFHVDAVQCFGKLPTDQWMHVGIDSCSVTAHKLGGVSGIGCLFLRRGRKLLPLLQGGPQEKKRRAGTENLMGIFSFGLIAQKILNLDYWNSVRKMSEMRDELWKKLNVISELTLHSPKNGSPNTVFFSFNRNHLRNEDFIVWCDLQKICVGSGSACSSSVLKESRSVRALGKSELLAKKTIRVSLSPQNRQEDIICFFRVLENFILEKQSQEKEKASRKNES